MTGHTTKLTITRLKPMTKQRKQRESPKRDSQQETVSNSMMSLDKSKAAAKWFLQGDNLGQWLEQAAKSIAVVLVFIYTAGVVLGDAIKPFAITFRERTLEELAELKRRADEQLNKDIELAVQDPKR